MSTTGNRLGDPKLNERVRFEYLGETRTGTAVERKLNAKYGGSEFIYYIDIGDRTVPVAESKIHVVL